MAMINGDDHIAMQIEETKYRDKYEFMANRFFKFNTIRNISTGHIDFVCQLCLPKINLISCSNGSIVNLKKHLDKFHHDFIEEYDDLCDEHLNAPIPIQPQESINFVRLAHTDPLVGNPLKYGFHSFLQESRYCDTVLHCSDGKISLHRLVLASASPFLRKCLRVDWKNCDYDADLILPDFSVADIHCVLPFLYGYAEESSEIKGSLLDCLQLGKYFGKALKRDASVLNFKIKQEPMGNSNFFGDVGYEQDMEEGAPMSALNSNDESKCHHCGGSGRAGGDYVQPKIDYSEEALYDDTIYEEEEEEQDDAQSEDEDWSEGPTKSKRKYKARKGKETKSQKTKKQPAKAKVKIKTEEGPKRTRKRRYVQEESGWRCLICNVLFPKKNQIRHHSDTCFESFDDGYKCGACKELFDSVPELKEHLNSRMDCYNGSPPTLICESCPKPHIFYNNRKYQAHVLRQHSVIKCEECNMQMDDDRNKYIEHLAVVHGKNSATQLFYCSGCSRAFLHKENLDKHIEGGHHDKKVFPCDKCGKNCNSMAALKYHLKKHENSTFRCPHCPKVLTSQQGLSNHVNMHNGMAEHLCNECGMSFVTRQRLVDHTRWKHTFERPYVCDLCGASFVRSYKLVVHKRRVHTGERPYSCEHCDWRGVDSSDLIHHRKKHHKNPPAYLPRQMIS